MIPEEIRKPFWITLTVLIMIGIGMFSIVFLGKENPVEEAVEDMVEHVSGIKIELSGEE